MPKLFDWYVSLGTSGLDAEAAGRMRSVQIGAVRKYTPWMMLASIGNALVIIAAFWSSAWQLHIALWATIVIGLAVFVLSRWKGQTVEAAPRVASRRGIRSMTINSAVFGALWGMVPALTYSSATADQRILLIGISAGMMCGSGFALSTVAPACIAFAGLVAFGSMIGLTATPGITSFLVSMLSLSYMAVIVFSALMLARTVRERVLSEMESEEQRNDIGLLLNDFEASATDCLWSIDRNYQLTRISDRFAALLGVPVYDLIGCSLFKLVPTPPTGDLTRAEKASLRNFQRSLVRKSAFRDVEIPVVINGERRYWSTTARPLYSSNGEFEGFRGVGHDVTEQLEARKHIEHMARFDALTGLANRVQLKDDLDAALSRLKRHGEKFALLLLDLDHFKMINDTQGHPVGDMLLVKVAERLRGIVREHDSIARLGGDEFAIVLTMIETEKEPANLADRINIHLSKPFDLNGATAQIGVSIGIAFAPNDGLDGDTLTRHADLALYRVKNDGRGGYHFFEPEMDAIARRRHRLEADMRKALETGGFDVHYQPLVDIQTGKVQSFEALARWSHPELGTLNPSEFIPLAEELGLIQELGRWILTQACTEASQWPDDVRVAVNLSPVQVRSSSLFALVKRILDDTGLPAARLELEVTETLLLDASAQVDETLKALKSLGVRIALDDFGTGYSSLSYLRKYRFDKIKLDRSFVAGIDTDPDSLAIVDAIIKMTRDLRISLTIEGVETKAQLEKLRERGCREVQGYLISRPGSTEQARAMLETQRDEKQVAA
jgi:diguanylate cyclase (GGDEF)-like protein/PAS domain S-box-containing protein